MHLVRGESGPTQQHVIEMTPHRCSVQHYRATAEAVSHLLSSDPHVHGVVIVQDDGDHGGLSVGSFRS